MIDQNTIDRIVDAAQIQDVISDYITLKKRGVNLLGLCPFHNEKTPSFMVSPAKGIFKCFGCGKGGNAVHFVMNHDQLSYFDALKVLARKYNIEVKERELSDEEKAVRNDRESMFLVNEFARNHFHSNLLQHVDGRAIGLSYFRERGFRDDIIAKFQLGYSLDIRDGFTQAALKAGYNREYLTKTGLTLENDAKQLSDRFRGRVMFPVHTLSGKVVAFGGRILKKDDKMAKYVNSPESEIYHKSNELYGIFFAKQAIMRHDKCFLVEGYTDVISMHQSGIENVVASSGTSLTPGQIRLIHRFTENVTVIYDGDPAGIKASIRGIDLLLEEGMNIKVLLLPDGDDPDSFARKHNADDFIDFVEREATDFIRFKTNLLLVDAGKDPIKRATLVRDIVKSIAIIPNQTIRSEYVKECSTLLNVEEQMLYFEINKIKAAEVEKRHSRASSEAVSQAVAPADEVVSTSIYNTASTRFENEEKNILRLLLKYGNESFEIENWGVIGVAEYILGDLEQDGLSFGNSLYASILEDYKSQMNTESFDPSKYFLNHSNSEVGMLTADLIVEKYQLSKIHEKLKKTESEQERLKEIVPRVMYEYKNSIVLDTIKQKLKELKIATEERDDDKINRIMRQMSTLELIKKELSNSLGKRIIIKL
jgi:DNA primase